MAPKHIVMLVATLGAGGLAIFGDRTPASGSQAVTATPVVEATEKAHAKPIVNTRTGEGQTLVHDLQPREAARRTLHTGGLFGSTSWAPPSPIAASAVDTPQAPALTLTYLGMQATAGGPAKALIADNDRVYIVQANDPVGEHYKVVSIDKQAIVFEYLPLGTHQTLSIK